VSAVGDAVVARLVFSSRPQMRARAHHHRRAHAVVPIAHHGAVFGAGFQRALLFSITTLTPCPRKKPKQNQNQKNQSQFAGVCVGIIVMLVLLFLTKLFALLPYCIMAAVIIGGVSTLIEVKYAYTLFRTDLRDFLIFMVTFFVVIFYSIDVGLGAGIGLSLFVYILETGFPSKQRLARFISGNGGAFRAFGGNNGALASPSADKASGLVIDAKGGRLATAADSSNSDDPTSDGALDQNVVSTTPLKTNSSITPIDTFVDAAEFSAPLTHPLPAGVVALRLQAPIAFNNVQALEDAIEDIVLDTELAHRTDPVANPLVQYVILDLVSSGHIDSSGCHSIGTEIAERMALKGVQVVLVGANKRILRALERTGALSKGNLRSWVFTNLADAVAATQHTRLILTEAAKAADAKAAKKAELAEKKKAKKDAKKGKKAVEGPVAAEAVAPVTGSVAAGVV
jgi:MFS superfamily sulfate permease-like transporter